MQACFGGSTDPHSGKRIGKSGFESGIVLAEAAARRVGFCMPFKNMSMDIAFVLPEDLKKYIHRSYMPAGREGQFDPVERDKQWTKIKNLFEQKVGNRVVMPGDRYCMSMDEALLSAKNLKVEKVASTGCGCRGHADDLDKAVVVPGKVQAIPVRTDSETGMVKTMASRGVKENQVVPFKLDDA